MSEDTEQDNNLKKIMTGCISNITGDTKQITSITINYNNATGNYVDGKTYNVQANDGCGEYYTIGTVIYNNGCFYNGDNKLESVTYNISFDANYIGINIGSNYLGYAYFYTE